MFKSISVKNDPWDTRYTDHLSRRLPYRSCASGVARLLPVNSIGLVELDVLPVQLIDESRLVVDQLVHFLHNMSHFHNTTFKKIDFIQSIRRAQVKVGLINLCKGLFSLNARIYYSIAHRQAVCNLPGGYSTILPHKAVHCSN
jgi:hypothetical protein